MLRGWWAGATALAQVGGDYLDLAVGFPGDLAGQPSQTVDTACHPMRSSPGLARWSAQMAPMPDDAPVTRRETLRI